MEEVGRGYCQHSCGVIPCLAVAVCEVAVWHWMGRIILLTENW